MNENIVKSIIEKLEGEERAVFLKLIMCAHSHNKLKSIQYFIDKVDYDSALDALILDIVHKVIGKVGNAVSDDMENRQKEGIQEYTGERALEISRKIILAIAADMNPATYSTAELH